MHCTQRVIHHLRGELALRQGDPAAAAGHFLDALTMARQHGVPLGGIWAGWPMRMPRRAITRKPGKSFMKSKSPYRKMIAPI
jgi:hypothetical protein